MTQNDNYNKITLEAYNNRVAAYIKNTPTTYNESHQPLLEWIDESLSHLKQDAKIIEIGSATLRDATYIRSKGFFVQTSDAAVNFVDHLKAQGENPLTLNITESSIDNSFDMLFANAVFPHFTNADTKNALTNIHRTLKKDGIVAFNVKQGEDAEWVNEKFDDKRYINYWQPHEIYDLVESSGFEVISIDDGVDGDLPTHTWIRIIAQKI